ncbi:predicted GPI-anchored protein 58 [Triticum urartu]|uniref:predicted GPI-anchored protein 58 n=1 Tax=Triticum urartu TaxID=4572 RepID=UPI00204328AF|nr:predicted GPI-anchored protein 58 [Triticum urartu]
MSSLTWCPCAPGSSTTPASPTSSRRRASRQATPPEHQDSPAPRRRSEPCLLRRPRAALHCCFPCDPRALPPLLRCRRTTASLMRTSSASRAAPIRCPKAKQPACPAPASPRSALSRRPSVPALPASIIRPQCTGSAPPSLLFAGAPVPRIRRGAAVPSSSRALALSVQLRRCLPSTPLLDPLLQGRDDGRPRRALTSPARPSACVQPTGPGPMFGFVPEL